MSDRMSNEDMVKEAVEEAKAKAAKETQENGASGENAESGDAKEPEMNTADAQDTESAEAEDAQSEAEKETEAGEEEKIASYYENQKQEKISQIKYTGAYIGIGIAAAAIIAAIAVNPLFAAGTVLGALYALYVFVSNERKKKQIARDCELSINSKTELLRKLFGEYAQMKQIYSEFDAYQDQIEEALKNL